MKTTKIKALILDMDGVLWKGYTPIVNLENVFEQINNLGLKYAFATNNSTKHISGYIDKLDSFNIPCTQEQIFTAAIVTAKSLKTRFPEGGNLFIVGEDGLVKTLEDYGFKNAKEDCLAVVSGLDFNIDYKKLALASSMVRDGLPFIGTNPDLSFPMPEGFYPGAGAILAFIEATSGVKPEIIGKPMLPIFQEALNTLGTKPEETLMIGDRLETDILGGQNAGCKTALVLSGVSDRKSGNEWKPQPDFIAENLEKLVEVITDGR